MADTVVLVTGASGYVATHIVQQLLQAGYKVRGTVRSLQDDKKVTPLRTICPSSQHNLELVEADLLTPESWIPAVRGCTYVIHTASPVARSWRGTSKAWEEFINPAVEGTLSVLRACRDVDSVRRVVFTGSMTAVAPYCGDSRIYNDTDWVNLSAAEMAYPKSKVMAEKTAWDFVKGLPDDERFELVTLLPSAVVGRVMCGYVAPSTGSARSLLENKLPFLPHICLNLVDVSDVALAHIRAMELPQAANRRFLITGENLWYKDVADVYRKEFSEYGYAIPTRVAPWFLIRILAWFDDEARHICNAWGKVHDFDNSPMKNILGVHPQDVRRSLIDMAHSMIQKGIIRRTDAYVKSRTMQKSVLVKSSL